MHKFKFRLENVLKFRRNEEERAKTLYREAQIRVIEAEAIHGEISRRRLAVLNQKPKTFQDRLSIQEYVDKLDADTLDLQVMQGVLFQEEETARQEWIKAKQELEAMERLKKKRLEDWQLESNRAEQRDLDEWTTMRRAA